MRTDSDNFYVANDAPDKDPRYVIEIAFDDAWTDLYYLTSHDDAAVPGGASSIAGVVQSIGGTTQKIKPEEASSEIGSIAVNVVDYQGSVTAVINTKLGDSKGLREKRIRVYVGFNGLDWADYSLITTQRIKDIAYNNGAYKFRCMDIQRAMRQKIFRLKKTNLAASISATATTITAPAGTLADFSTVYHGTSYSDAPSSTVGYLKIDDEIIRYTGVNDVTGEFTGCTRGVLNTKAAEHIVDATASSDRRPIIEEVVYLELPAIKLAYALLTGSLYGDGASLPDHWHLGIDSAYVQASAFTGIGPDLWDTSNDDAGQIVRFVGLDNEDGKKFIEKELLLLVGCFMPVGADGALGLKRMSGVLSGASYVQLLNEDNVVSYGELTHDLRGIHNRVRIDWNYREDIEKFTRTHLLVDADSITTHGDADLMTLEFRGLHGSRHTYGTIMALFDAWRDRVAGPPLKIRLELLPHLNKLEVGDIVRVQLDAVRDFNTNAAIDRSMEVQSIQIDWVTGKVRVDLFGSSQKATPLTDPIDGSYGAIPNTALADSFYTSAGTDLSTVAGITITDVGGVGHITAVSTTLAGTSDLTASGSIYYYNGDLTLDAGVTLPISDNVQLRVKGYFTVNGTIDGAGNGLAGAASGAGTVGLLGTTQGGGGVALLYNGGIPTLYNQSKQGRLAVGLDTVPVYEIRQESGALVNLPTELRGTSGGAGNSIIDLLLSATVAAGGAGGAGGAGLCIISRGLGFGVNGVIDTSGEAGTAGAFGTFSKDIITHDFYAGSGAGGAPGAVLFIGDGKASLIDVADANITANQAATTPQGVVVSKPSFNFGVSEPTHSYYTGTRYAVDMDAVSYRVLYLNSELTAEDDVPDTTSEAAAVTVVEYTDTPKSPAGNLSSLEVSVTEPTDGNYDFSNIYYRVYNVGDEWQWSGVVDHNGEHVIVVPSDGTVYEITALSVSIVGVENPAGPTTTITTTNVITPTLEDTPISNILIPPNVSGLELDGQGNDTEFAGKDAKFAWRITSTTDWYELGQEPDGLGGDAGGLDLYFAYYEVRIYDDTGAEVRVEKVTDNWYVYTLEKNVQDYTKKYGRFGAWREFTIKVWIVTRQNQVSERAARLTVSNTAPALPTNVRLRSSIRNIYLTFDQPDDIDYLGVRVWISTSSGFARNPTTQLPDVIGTSVVIDQLPDGSHLQAGVTYYVRFALFDAFGKTGLSESAEYSITTQEIDNQDINSGPGSGLNADLLDNYHASATPTANTIPVAGADGRLPFGSAPEFRGALVYITSDQVVSGTGNTILFDSEKYDTDEIHDLITNTDRLTVPDNVNYVRIAAQVAAISTLANGTLEATINHSGGGWSPVGRAKLRFVTTTEEWVYFESPVLQVSGGEYFNLKIYETSTGTVSVKSAAIGIPYTWMSMEIIN